MIEKLLGKTLYFLGSALFAVILLSLAALFVAYGTFVESQTGSHQLAMESVYSSLPFRLLLGGFFLNILISAVRRYPFRLRHIPFLITHLGLLMIISGLIIKSFFGLQGLVAVRAGSETGAAIIPEELELIAEVREGDKVVSYRFPFHKDYLGRWTVENPHSSFSVRILDSRAHSTLNLDSFFKRGFLHIRGLTPMPVAAFEEGRSPPLSGKIKLHRGDGGVVGVIAVEADEPALVIREALLDAKLALFLCGDSSPVYSGTLREALAEGINKKGFKASLELADDVSDLAISYGKESVSLDLKRQQMTSTGEKMLQRVGKIRKIELSMEPKLLFIKDNQGSVELASFDGDGKLAQAKMGPECQGARFLSYDDGFMGYSVEMPLTSSLIDTSASAYEKAALFFAAERLSALSDHLLPLLFFSEGSSAKKDEAPELLALFQKSAADEGTYLYKGSISLPEKVQEAIAESTFFNSREELTQALKLTALLVDDALGKAPDTKTLKEAFQRAKIPLPQSIEEEDNVLFLGKLSELAFLLSKELHEALPSSADSPLDKTTKAKLLSLLLRLYALSFQEVVPDGSFQVEDYIKRQALFSQIAFHFPPLLDLPIREGMQAFKKSAENEGKNPVIKELLREALAAPYFSKDLLGALEIEEADRIRHTLNSPPLYLESTVSFRFEPVTESEVKGEERKPLFLLDVHWNQERERLMLAGSRGGSLPIPFFEGKVKLSVAPRTVDIPYLVRVQDAKEIAYPGSIQAKEYESVLYLKDVRTGRVERRELGLNRVFETEDGYRFFLSSITPADESDVPEVRLALNYDPSKRIFVFAGSILVALGIVLLYLFSMRKKVKP